VILNVKLFGQNLNISYFGLNLDLQLLGLIFTTTAMLDITGSWELPRE